MSSAFEPYGFLQRSQHILGVKTALCRMRPCDAICFYFPLYKDIKRSTWLNGELHERIHLHQRIKLCSTKKICS